MPGSAQSTLLVHEVMEEEWSALRSVEGRPEVSAQVRLGCVFSGRGYSTGLLGVLSPCFPKSSNPAILQPPLSFRTTLNPGSSTLNVRLFWIPGS